MYEKLRVENFKSLKQIEIDNLSNINLFFGKNNCGKTTLLESIFLLSGTTNPELFKRINLFRNYKYIKDFSYFYNNFKTGEPILLKANGEKSFENRESKIQFSERPGKKLIKSDNDFAYSVNNGSFIDSLDINSKINGENVNSRIVLKHLKAGETLELSLPSAYKELVYCNYLSANYSFETIPSMVEKIIQNKEESQIVDALQQIDPRIKNFVYFEKQVMVDVGLEKRVPINMLGDGVRKFFSLIVAILDSSNGVLLVDEIDNGLHFSSMKMLWKIIIQLSLQFNVQLFATSHNIDSLKGLANNLNDSDYKNNISAYKIVRKNNDETYSLYYNADNFSSVLNEENEIR